MKKPNSQCACSVCLAAMRLCLSPFVTYKPVNDVHYYILGEIIRLCLVTHLNCLWKCFSKHVFMEKTSNWCLWMVFDMKISKPWKSIQKSIAFSTQMPFLKTCALHYQTHLIPVFFFLKKGEDKVFYFMGHEQNILVGGGFKTFMLNFKFVWNY